MEMLLHKDRCAMICLMDFPKINLDGHFVQCREESQGPLETISRLSRNVSRPAFTRNREQEKTGVQNFPDMKIQM